jgi:DNA-binding NtrC family response regulator
MASAPMPGSSRPRYFHLLSEADLDELQPVLEAIIERREEVLENWHSLYVLHLGTSRSLPKSEFMRLCRADLDATAVNLRARNFDGFAVELSRLGEQLAEQRVPFAELVVSMHLFEESVVRAVPADVMANRYPTFDRLSHCRVILLADAYFRSHSAASVARIRALEQEAARLPGDRRTNFHGLVGASASMRALYQRITAAAATRGTVFIVGETGSGKELVARAIHECGPASERSFVALNCAAIPRELVESELFGYKRGAFSGATGEYLGLFRAAQGGTLFLDEITEMGPATQSKLLRAIQERTVRPVGSTAELPVDVRLIASTNRDPWLAVRAGELREDLYFRLQVNVLRVPSLKERVEDIPLLVEHFIALFNERMGGARVVTGIEPEALEELQRRDWPGNVRELCNVIESAFTFGRSSVLKREDLPPVVRQSPIGRPEPPARAETRLAGPVPTFADLERDLVRRALESTGGNKVQAARLLGVSRKRLYAKLRKYKFASFVRCAPREEPGQSGGYGEEPVR